MAQLLVLDSREDIFVCGQCKSIFTTLALFLDHKRELCGNKEVPKPDENSMVTFENNVNSSESLPKYKESCDQCVVPTNATVDTTENCELVDDVSCRICLKSFKSMKSLLAHLRIHNGKPYQCFICGRCFSQSSHLKRHEISHKVWPGSLSETTARSTDTDTASYTCMYCDTVLSSYGQFRIHLKNHMALKLYKCVQNDCTSMFETIDLLLQHVSEQHIDPIYACPYCSDTFKTLHESAAHQQTHQTVNKDDVKPNSSTSDNKFKCNYCDAAFKKKDKLALHMTMENHSKTCIHCSKTFASDKRLRIHLQIHKKVKTFECNVCGQSFSMRKYLSSHMLKHGEGQFTCVLCTHKFKRRDLLQRHMRSHQPKKMFKCPFKQSLGCKMEFTRNDKLNQHVKHHTKQLSSNHNNKRNGVESTVEILIVPLESEETD